MHILVVRDRFPVDCQREHERCAALGVGFVREFTAVVFHNCATDGQPQPHTICFSAEKGRRDFFHVISGIPGPVSLTDIRMCVALGWSRTIFRWRVRQ